MRRILTIALTLGALTAMGAPAHAGHAHFVHIEATNTCQYVGHGQTSIDEEGHGGYHRIHDNVHTGTPGTDGRGNTFDKQGNVGNYDGCVERGQR